MEFSFGGWSGEFYLRSLRGTHSMFKSDKIQKAESPGRDAAWGGRAVG